MNKKQRIIISIGIFLVILSGLFTPYEGEWQWGWGGDTIITLKKYMGYHFLFLPPDERAVYYAFREEWEYLNWSKESRLSSHIIASRVWVQVVTIVVATIGLLFLFSEKRKDKSSNKQDADDI